MAPSLRCRPAVAARRLDGRRPDTGADVLACDVELDANGAGRPAKRDRVDLGRVVSEPDARADRLRPRVDGEGEFVELQLRCGERLQVTGGGQAFEDPLIDLSVDDVRVAAVRTRCRMCPSSGRGLRCYDGTADTASG
jgi:hypothetical protein